MHPVQFSIIYLPATHCKDRVVQWPPFVTHEHLETIACRFNTDCYNWYSEQY